MTICFIDSGTSAQTVCHGEGDTTRGLQSPRNSGLAAPDFLFKLGHELGEFGLGLYVGVPG